MPDKFFPQLSSVVTLDRLPEQLGFIQNGLNNIFDKLFYRDFQYIKSENGDSTFYSLVIVSHKKIVIDIP